MKKLIVVILAVAALSWAALAQTQPAAQPANQTSSQASAQTSTQTSTQGSTTGATGAASGNTAANASAGQNGANAGVANGTVINATLSKSVDSKKVKSGDAVEAKTAADVRSEGKTIIPRGSKLIGHVTQATAKGKGDADSTLAIVFDRALLKNGQQIPLHATIQALAAAQSAVTAGNDDMMGSASGSGMGNAGASGGPGSAAGSTVGGVGSTAGGVVGGAANTAGNTAGSATGTLDNTVGATTNTVGSASHAGLSTTGELTSTSRGVIGMPGVTLSQATSATQGTTITSTGKNVKLDSGTQMVLSVAGGASTQ